MEFLIPIGSENIYFTNTSDAEFTPVLNGDGVVRSLVFCVIFCRPLFDL